MCAYFVVFSEFFKCCDDFSTAVVLIQREG